MAEPRKGAKNNSGQEPATVIVFRVVPRSSRIAISQEGPSEFKVRLTSPPVEGAANAQLLKILCDRLALPSRCVQLISGQNARIKRILIQGLDLRQIADRLA
jgi:hypothetical protein